MTFLKKLGCAAALALCAAGAQAAPVMNGWSFDPSGPGGGKAVKINEYLDVNGNGFIQLTKTEGSSFTFVEHAVFNISQYDSLGAPFPGAYVTATMEAYGAGNFSGEFAFTSGTIKMYSSPTFKYGSNAGYYGANTGTLIGTFSLLAGGGGRVDASGDPTDNGNVSVFASASKGQLKEGYFFDNHGVDMSTLDNFAFAFTNANTVGKPDTTLVKELVCQFSGYTGDGCKTGRTPGTYKNIPGQQFIVSNNGQFKFSKVAAEVPEPGSVALFGIALFGIGALRRRVK